MLLAREYLKRIITSYIEIKRTKSKVEMGNYSIIKTIQKCHNQSLELNTLEHNKLYKHLDGVRCIYLFIVLFIIISL